MLLEAETNKYFPSGYDFGAISNFITWVLNFFLSVYRIIQHDWLVDSIPFVESLIFCGKKYLLNRVNPSEKNLAVRG